METYKRRYRSARITLIAMCFALAGCGGGDGSSRSATTGSIAVLRAPDGQGVPVAASREAFDRLVTLAVADDNTGISHMMVAGQVWTAPCGTRCKVIDSGFTVYEVRILEGDHAGRACFVAREFVKREQ